MNFIELFMTINNSKAFSSYYRNIKRIGFCFFLHFLMMNLTLTFAL